MVAALAEAPELCGWNASSGRRVVLRLLRGSAAVTKPVAAHLPGVLAGCLHLPCVPIGAPGPMPPCFTEATLRRPTLHACVPRHILTASAGDQLCTYRL